MKSVFNDYPRVLYTLLFFFFLEQIIFYNFYYTAAVGRYNEYGLDALTDSYFYAFSIEHFFMASAILTIVGGLIFDRIPNIKKVFQWAVSLIFLGCVLVLLKSQIAFILSVILVLTGSAIFGIGIILHIAVLFPYADDFKDNAFMMWFFVSGTSVYFSGFISRIQYDLNASGLVSVGLSLFLLILVSQNKLIGYEISETADEPEEESVNFFPLIFCTILYFLMDINARFLPAVNQDYSYTYDLDWGYYSPALMSAVFWIILAWFLLSKAKEIARQLTKIIWAMAFLIGVGVFEFISRSGSTASFDFLTDNIIAYIPALVIYPCLFSIITHNNFDKNAGLWLGIMMGFPSILVTLIENRVFSENYYVVGVVLLVLLTAALIWFRENKEFLIGKLNLEDSTQEIEEDDESEDPYDHLIS